MKNHHRLLVAVSLLLWLLLAELQRRINATDQDQEWHRDGQGVFRFGEKKFFIQNCIKATLLQVMLMSRLFPADGD